MADEIFDEENQKLKITIQSIDQQIKSRDAWLKQTKAEAGYGEPASEKRRVFEEDKRKLTLARPSPYFGRVDFSHENKKDTIKTYYFGRYHIPMDHVFSWDSDVADLFHDPAADGYTVKHTGQKITGEVSLKRHLTIENTQLLNLQDLIALPVPGKSFELVKSATLASALAKPKSDRLRDIVETIQPEQFRQIKGQLDQVMIVQGVAGSGKTEVGIHRLAYLLSPHRETRLHPEDVIFFGPSQVFLNYISSVLPGLDVPRIRQTTVSEWLNGTLSHKVRWSGKDLLQERVMNGLSKDLEKLIEAEKIKNSLKMAYVLEQHVLALKEQFYKNITDVIVGGRVISKGIRLKRIVKNSRGNHPNDVRSELATTLLHEARKNSIFADAALSKQVDKEINRFWPFVDFTDEYYSLITSIEKLTAAAKKKMTDKDISNLVAFGTKLGKNKLTDLPALCYLDHLLNNRLTGEKNNRIYSHIVVDEAQDVSPLEFTVMQLHSRNNSFSILGDTAQSVLPYKGIIGWQEIQKLFLKKSTRMLKAPFSYRSTLEITKYTREVLKAIDPSQLKPRPYHHHGEKVKFIRSSARQESMRAIADDIRRMPGEFRKIAVLCRTAKEARVMQETLRDTGLIESMLLDNQTLNSRIIVASIMATKGLEFDAVIITNASNKNFTSTNIDNRLLYLALTRAAHSLHIHWHGRIADILAVPSFYDTAMRKLQKTKGRKRPEKKIKSQSVKANADESEHMDTVDPKEWTGPLACEFVFVKEHFNVVRYRCLMGKHYFDFYVPRYVFDTLNLEKPPDGLEVTVWNPNQITGLSDIHQAFEIEYLFNREMANYQLYELNKEGQPYSLYIPKDMFGGLPRPKRVSVRVALCTTR